MFLSPVDVDLTLRYLANTEEWEKKEALLAKDLLFKEKTEKQRGRKCLRLQWYYRSMWQLLQRGMEDAGGAELRCAASSSADAIRMVVSPDCLSMRLMVECSKFSNVGIQI